MGYSCQANNDNGPKRFITREVCVMKKMIMMSAVTLMMVAVTGCSAGRNWNPFHRGAACGGGCSTTSAIPYSSPSGAGLGTPMYTVPPGNSLPGPVVPQPFQQ